MSNPRADGDGDGEGDDDAKDNALAKAAGFVVFSGIAMSILKSLNPFNKPTSETQTAFSAKKKSETQIATQSLTESTQPIHSAHQSSLPLQEPVSKKPKTCINQNVTEVPESSQKTIEIVKGDTLWGLSRKHGVSIDEIKKANGLTGDTIYAGKKLVIP